MSELGSPGIGDLRLELVHTMREREFFEGGGGFREEDQIE